MPSAVLLEAVGSIRHGRVALLDGGRPAQASDIDLLCDQASAVELRQCETGIELDSPHALQHPYITDEASLSPVESLKPPLLSSPAPSPLVTRRESKAARAIMQIGAACRRISEVGIVSGISAVTSAAASWVLPSHASKRRVSTSWPQDPEAAISPRCSDSLSTPLRNISSPLSGPPAARRFSSVSVSPGLTVGVSISSPECSSPPPNEAAYASAPPSGATAANSARAALHRRMVGPPLPLPPLPAVAIAAVSSAVPLSPIDKLGPGSCFKARATPADGLLYLAPAARAGMWNAARGAKWSAEQYDLTRRLYRGYASTVFKATCLTSSNDVVLKVYSLPSLTDFLRHQVLRELDIHSRLKHPGIVQLLAAFREGDTLVLVLEYVRGGSLDQARKRLGGRMNEQWALHLVVLPLLRVLSYMHRLGVVHRDLKPENILFTPDWRLKLCDFGVSIYLYEERAVTRAGSSDYMAPEVNACPLKATPSDNKVNDQLAYGAAADVWSLGAVVYELLVGFTPFPGGPPPSATGRANLGCPAPLATSLAFPSRVSPAGRSFVAACLEPHPGDRPTVEQLMQHAWVLGAQQAPPAEALEGCPAPEPSS